MADYSVHPKLIGNFSGFSSRGLRFLLARRALGKGVYSYGFRGWGFWIWSLGGRSGLQMLRTHDFGLRV